MVKGDNGMDHAIDIMFDRVEARAEERRAIAIAKAMLADGKPTDEVVKYSGLDLNTVLKLQS